MSTSGQPPHSNEPATAVEAGDEVIVDAAEPKHRMRERCHEEFFADLEHRLATLSHSDEAREDHRFDP